MNKKYRATLMLASTGDQLFAAANVIIGVLKWSPGLFDRIIIFHDGNACDTDFSAMSEIFPCEYQEYDLSPFEKLEKGSNIKRFTLMAFARYEIFSQLEFSEKILYLDTDILIQDDISDIFDYGPLGMNPRANRPVKTLPISFEWSEAPDPEQPTYNSGVIFADDTLDYENLTKQCYKYTFTYWKDLKFLDQEVLNYLILSHKLPVCDLPAIFNINLSSSIGLESKILHTAGIHKFWSNGLVNFYRPEWQKNHQKWLQLGGSEYSGPRKHWSFSSFRSSPLTNLLLMGDIYNFAITYFIDCVIKSFETHFYPIEVIKREHSFILNLSDVEKYIFEVAVFDTINIKFFTNEKISVDRIKQSTALQSTLCKEGFVFKQTQQTVVFILTFDFKTENFKPAIYYQTALYLNRLLMLVPTYLEQNKLNSHGLCITSIAKCNPQYGGSGK